MKVQVNGGEVGVYDCVSFNTDVEQAGFIRRVTHKSDGHYYFLLEDLEGFKGIYIGGQTQVTVDSVDCYL